MKVVTAAVRPAPRQQAAGQRWVACTVYLQNQQGEIASSAQQQRYDGTLHNSLFTGRARDRTGTCVPTSDWSGGQDADVPCSSRHRGEASPIARCISNVRPRAPSSRAPATKSSGD